MVASVTIGQAASTMDEARRPGGPYGILRKPIPEKVVVLTFDDGDIQAGPCGVFNKRSKAMKWA